MSCGNCSFGFYHCIRARNGVYRFDFIIGCCAFNESGPRISLGGVFACAVGFGSYCRCVIGSCGSYARSNSNSF